MRWSVSAWDGRPPRPMNRKSYRACGRGRHAGEVGMAIWRGAPTGPIAGAMNRLFLFLAALLLGAAPAAADILVDNVNGYTLREDGRLDPLPGDAGSATTARSGNCSRRGDRRPARTAFRIDGRGRTLIPGLIDAHGHVMGLGMGALLIDLSDTNSLAGGAGADPRLCRRQPDAALDRRARLEPGALAARPLPDRRRSRRRGRRPAGLAGAGRRPCRLGEQPGDAGGGHHRRHPGAGTAAGSSGPGAAPAASSSTRR